MLMFRPYTKMKHIIAVVLLFATAAIVAFEYKWLTSPAAENTSAENGIAIIFENIYAYCINPNTEKTNSENPSLFDLMQKTDKLKYRAKENIRDKTFSLNNLLYTSDCRQRYGPVSYLCCFVSFILLFLTIIVYILDTDGKKRLLA